MRVTGSETHGIRLASSPGSLIPSDSYAVIPSDSEGSRHRQAYETGTESHGISASSPGSLVAHAPRDDGLILCTAIPSDSEGSRHRQAYETGTAIHGIRRVSSPGSLVAHAPRDDGLMLYTVIPSDSEGSRTRQAYETGTAIHGIRRESSSGSKTPRSREALPIAGDLPLVDGSVATLLRMTAVLL